jgi:hypothetical protein
MSAHHDHHTTSHPPGGHAHSGRPNAHGGRGHGWMMIICCIPMLAIAGLLVLTGVASAGLLVTAVVCTAMMAMMMGAMHGGEHDDAPTANLAPPPNQPRAPHDPPTRGVQ